VDYSKPRSHFPNPIAPYEVSHVDSPNLKNGVRLGSLIHDGKLMLSLDDAVALALENNLDIAISRDNLNIAQTDIMRAEGGSSILGVNTGIVQNTPGGGVGGLSGVVGSGTGGTSPGSAGIATGTNGLVNSTLGLGSTITSFDPIVTGTLQMDRLHTPSTNSVNGLHTLNTNTGTADLAYTQGLQWGTNVAVNFNNTHTTSSNHNNLYSPDISPSTLYKLSQPVLQGFGKVPNTRFIRIAQNNVQVNYAAFRLQVITTVDQIESIYWNLVYAYENVQVQQDALTYAQTILKDTRTQVKYGVDQPIQIANAESTVALDQNALILAQTNLDLQQLLMKNAVSRTLDDSSVIDAAVVPTSKMEMPTSGPETAMDELLRQAFANRAELQESHIDLATRQLSEQAVNNAVRPIVTPSIYYGGSGLGGAINPRVPLCSSTVTTRCYNETTAPSGFRNGGTVGYGSALGQTFNDTAPDYGVSANITLPLRNRIAQANQTRSQLEDHQAELRLQQLENQVRIEVRNAQFDVTQNRVSVESAQKAVDLAKQSLYAEQRRLNVGVSDPDNVLQMHSALVSAQSNLLSAQVAYEEALVELGRATGLLLENNGILISDARQGRVTTPPQVPGITQ
jgi:outer membrane protein TolC